MQARISLAAERALSAYVTEVAILRRALSGATTLQAIDLAEAALDRMPSKAELRMLLRSAKAGCREHGRAPARHDFAIPAVPA